MDGDEDTTMVIPGDIWLRRLFVTRLYPDGESWLKKLAKRFKYVVLVLGNHDYWDQNLLYEGDRVKAAIALQGITNCFLLDKSMVVLDQVKFLGGTLWTDFNRHHPHVMYSAKNIMGYDYDTIKFGRDFKRVLAQNFYDAHQNTKNFIFENAQRDHPWQKLVVVTHMAPSYRSVPVQHRTAAQVEANFYYFSNLEERIKMDGKELDLWLHGHTHGFSDYLLDDHLRVVCNARGYFEELNVGFQPQFRIDLDYKTESDQDPEKF